MATSNNIEHHQMETIRVRKLNHSTIHLMCDRSVSTELREFFSFFVPGYRFMPAYRNRIWDGKIRLFNQTTGEIPAGLFPQILAFAESREYELEIDDSEYGNPNEGNTINADFMMKFVEALKLPFKIRDYQFDAVCHGIQRKNAILLSPTGSGKSLIIYVLMRYLLSSFEDKNILVIVPTTSLVEQMYNDFKTYGYNVEANCHRIYSGKDKNTTKRVIISTWQSIYKFPQAWFERFGSVFGDECHGFKSRSLTSIMNKCIEAEYRFGTTGTLDGAQTHELVLQGLFGKIHRVTSTRQLQDDDTLAKLEIRRIVLQHKEEIRKTFGKQTYQDELQYVVSHKSRNTFIRNLTLDLEGNTLVLYNYVEKHGKPLHTLIKEKAEEGRKIFFVSGNTAATDREAIRAIVEKQKNSVIVASLGTFSTGINIRNLHNIVFASPSKSQIRVLQSIGRGLRKTDDGKSTTLYDIVDDISWKSRKNYGILHADERLRIYGREKFTHKTYRVEL
jgi:superfamily II DNA or RNA helicase